MDSNSPFPSSLDPVETVFKKEEDNKQIEIFKELLKSMGIASYEENIIPMLIEFVTDYHNKILSEARTYAEVSNSSKITVNHLREATSSLSKRYFSYQRSVHFVHFGLILLVQSG